MKEASTFSKLLTLCQSFPAEAYKLPEIIRLHPSDYTDLINSEEARAMVHTPTLTEARHGLRISNVEIFPDINVPQGEVDFIVRKKLEGKARC